MQASKNFTYQLNNYIGQPVVSQERDACGVGFLAQLNKGASHNVVVQALQCLTCMEHRGACSADRDTGDGAGITTQVPWELFNSYMPDKITESGKNIGVAMVFFPKNYSQELQSLFDWTLEDENLEIIGWRTVPVIDEVLGIQAKQNKPIIKQCFVRSNIIDTDILENKLFIVRKKIEKAITQAYQEVSHDFYICSFSNTTIVYKGMLRSAVLGQFYQDLYNPKYKSTFAIYHRRFSTNTMPKWPLAQPMRFIAHNGEINTLLGNLNWMKSRESLLSHTSFNNYIDDINPIVNYENSDSANLDGAIELLIKSGMGPEEALMILIPEAYKNQPALKKQPCITSFYEYYSHLQEPWDGPALVVFTDGKKVGATLDRNGLRPARYTITSNDLIILSSESGIIELDPTNVKVKGRLGPGQMFSVDISTSEILDNWGIKKYVASKFPYQTWLNNNMVRLGNQNYVVDEDDDHINMMRLHTAFGYSNEDIELVIEHMASSAKEPTFCMGDDIPLAILSSKGHLLYDYFKQRFAQVTNPAIDPLRENLVMSLETKLGPKGNLLSPSPIMARSIHLDSPIINEIEIEALANVGFSTSIISTIILQDNQHNQFKEKITEICSIAEAEARSSTEIIILTDKIDKVAKGETFLPPLLIVGAVHHHLIQNNLRHKVSVVIETGQCWSTHHFACLIGYGASAVCPYLAFRTARHWWYQDRTQKLMSNGKIPDLDVKQAQHNYRIAIETGLLKILSKMGISLISSYHGAQIFEILGLGLDIVDIAFRGTTSRIGGMNLVELSKEVQDTYNAAFFVDIPKKLINLGYVQYRPGAEYHINNPEMSKTLHKAVRSQDQLLYDKYKSLLESRPPTNLRDLLTLNYKRKSISIDEVESIESILSRFCTGGMSLGALSRETHETLAIAMNRIGGKSNSGEGGEDPQRFQPIRNVNALGTADHLPHLKGLKNGDIANSAIKQIASGRFGVTPEYLMSAEQIEIKIAQGAKPGEGGQLPGKKVSPYIAELRNCKSGVTLISPPPHHDIYSIEDLSQLIFDLHQINPTAKVSVKLVSEIGIGTIAAGVAKGNADIIQISGHDGGTGASPLSSIKHAGSPWELGLTEVHQLLLKNHLRDRVLLRVDGGLRTGLDLVIAAIMGAEEFGFGTVAMIATGCVMARICHTNNCPVGVATQRQDLRNRYPGVPTDLVNFFIFIAEEVRSILADLGYHDLNEIIGVIDLLKVQEDVQLAKTKHININTLLIDSGLSIKLSPSNDTRAHENGPVLDDELLVDPIILDGINSQSMITKQVKLVNTNRSVGARISGKITKLYGKNGFHGKINIVFQGTAGQSYGAFICKGMNFTLFGEANDYVGKGMNGGELVIRPQVNVKYNASQQVIIGNTCLYGATGGYLFVNGQAGERFAVRNSLAQAVVEGVGDHACEYMTGGIVIVIGKSGRNIGAGMTGGIAYFLDEDSNLLSKVNKEIVLVQSIKTHEAAQQLKDILEMHLVKTESPKTKEILEDWSNYLPMFMQLVPPSEINSPLTNISFSSYKTVI